MYVPSKQKINYHNTFDTYKSVPDLHFMAKVKLLDKKMIKVKIYPDFTMKMIKDLIAKKGELEANKYTLGYRGF